MSHAIKQFAGLGFASAVILAAACSPRSVPPPTVTDLMEDRVTLDGILMKCNRSPAAVRTDDCRTARIAIERLAAQNEPADEAKHSEEFERSREQLRLGQDKRRREQEAAKRVDAYSLPVIPVDPSPAPADTRSQPPVPKNP